MAYKHEQGQLFVWTAVINVLILFELTCTVNTFCN